MPLPVGSVPSPGSAPTGGSAGALQTQLEEAARQLADCLTCATAHTTAGQARIQRLTARVQALRSRIAQVATQSRQVPTTSASAGAGPGGNPAIAPSRPGETQGPSPVGPLGQAVDLRG